jgi:hypothetical protein
MCSFKKTCLYFPYFFLNFLIRLSYSTNVDMKFNYAVKFIELCSLLVLNMLPFGSTGLKFSPPLLVIF